MGDAGVFKKLSDLVWEGPTLLWQMLIQFSSLKLHTIQEDSALSLLGVLLDILDFCQVLMMYQLMFLRILLDQIIVSTDISPLLRIFNWVCLRVHRSCTRTATQLHHR